MADALATLVRDAFGDDARILDRHPAAYRSTLPVEEVTIVTGDGHERRLAAKRVAPRESAREIAGYRDVLARLRLATPAFVAAGDGVLLVEWVDGTPLWQSGDPTDWDAAARWLAALHAAPVPAQAAWLPRHGEQSLCRWGDPPAPGLADLAAAASAAAGRLAALPAGLVHGEFYPANVLVDHGRIRPVDWETLAIGPGVMDLAALTSGTWAGGEPERMRDAYLDALPGALAPPPGALADARLVVALRWAALPEPPGAPPGQAHDWAAEARRRAREVAR